MLGRAWAFRSGDRVRIFGLFAFGAAMAAAVGWGRGWAGEYAGFEARYLTLATPLWCWLAVVFRLYAPPALGGWLDNALFATACILFWPNADAGLSHSRRQAETTEALALDIRNGLPPYRIVRRYTPFLHPGQDEVARRCSAPVHRAHRPGEAKGNPALWLPLGAGSRAGSTRAVRGSLPARRGSERSRPDTMLGRPRCALSH
ncbi:hypothetical protein BH23PLA1_BH23PLA1_31470 [soil metagenome]